MGDKTCSCIASMMRTCANAFEFRKYKQKSKFLLIPGISSIRKAYNSHCTRSIGSKRKRDYLVSSYHSPSMNAGKDGYSELRAQAESVLIKFPRNTYPIEMHSHAALKTANSAQRHTRSHQFVAISGNFSRRNHLTRNNPSCLTGLR